MLWLSRDYSAKPTAQSHDLLRIGDAIAHIEVHYMNKITLDELAAKGHLSKRHFCRIFREHIGRPPIDHLMHVRCQKAAELLKSTGRPIIDIALECGFSDGSHLTRCFRKARGRIPS